MFFFEVTENEQEHYKHCAKLVSECGICQEVENQIREDEEQ